MTSILEAWSTFKRVPDEFAELLARAPDMTSLDRLEALLRLLDRLDIAFLDLPNAENEKRPDSSWQNTWKTWFTSIQAAFPELTTYRFVHPTSPEWPEPTLRALPDELALVLSNVDHALWLDHRGNEGLAARTARVDYEEHVGARIAHLRAYVFHQRFQSE